MKMKNKRIEFVLTQNKHEFKKRRLQFDREILQRDKKTMRQNQQHEKRMFQMQIQLTILQNKNLNKNKQKVESKEKNHYSFEHFFMNNQNFDDF